MKKILLSLTAAAALAAAAAPAAAQTWGHDNQDGYNRGYAGAQRTVSSLDGLDWKINRAQQERRISWREANQLRAELRQVQPIAWRVQNGRANGVERMRLERTVSRIEAAVNSYAHNDRDRFDDHRDFRR